MIDAKGVFRGHHEKGMGSGLFGPGLVRSLQKDRSQL